MKPLDPRLIRRAVSARWFLAVGGALGGLQTLAVIAFAWCTAQAVSLAVDGATLAELAPVLGGLAAAVLVRAATVWAMEGAAAAASARVKAELRAGVLRAVARLGAAWGRGRSGASTTTAVTTGLDALDAYFGRYLPQLILTVVATPVIVLVMLLQEPLSAVIVVIALPLIPVFMVLVGWATQAVQQRQWEKLNQLSGAFLEVVGGLATLKIFGRQYRQRARLQQVSEEYRRTTMSVLRVSFLSGFVLELAASLSVALVAVEIGLRLLDGGLALGVGLFVLLLAPEAFLPVRGVGVQFHAAADGLAAADEVLDLLDAADAASGDAVADASGGSTGAAGAVDADGRRSTTWPPGHRADVELLGLTVDYGGRTVVDALTARFAAGTVTVLSGPSGAGKTSVVRTILGQQPYSGIIHGAGPDDIAWAGQTPGLLAGTIAENVALGSAAADPAAVTAALDAAGLPGIDVSTSLGAGGSGLSGGQAQRVAIARALYRLADRGCGVLLLDEPTSALDADSERTIIDTMRRTAEAGAVVIAVSHRPAVVASADRVVRVQEAARV